MAEIKNEIQYQKLLKRIEELLQVVGNDTPVDDKNFVELDLSNKNKIMSYKKCCLQGARRPERDGISDQLAVIS